MRIPMLLGLAGVAIAAGCSDVTETRLGGPAFDGTISAVTDSRLPEVSAVAFTSRIGGNVVVDSLVGFARFLKPLEGRARYQFWVVSGLDSTAYQVSHTQWLVRTDSTLDSLGNILTPTDTQRVGLRDFFAGANYGRVLRFSIAIPATDTLRQNTGWLVLTMQPDSTTSSYTRTTPKPFFLRFRDQRGSVSRADDSVSTDTVRSTFGEFVSPTVRRAFVSRGSGTMLFWDALGDTTPRWRLDISNLTRPPRGFYYQAYIVDSLTGQNIATGLGVDAAGTPLFNADTLADSLLPSFRLAQVEDTAIGRARAYTSIQLRLEPKLAVPTLLRSATVTSVITTHRGTLPPLVTATRPGAGTARVFVTRTALTGTPVRRATILAFGAGANFSTLIGRANTDSSGVVLIPNLPAGPVLLRLVPPTSLPSARTQEQRVTITARDTLTQRFVIP